MPPKMIVMMPSIMMVIIMNKMIIIATRSIFFNFQNLLAEGTHDWGVKVERVEVSETSFQIRSDQNLITTYQCHIRVEVHFNSRSQVTIRRN